MKINIKIKIIIAFIIFILGYSVIINFKSITREIFAPVPDYRLGDEVEFKGERFFVIKDIFENDEMLTLLTKYNITTYGPYEQKDDTYDAYEIAALNIPTNYFSEYCIAYSNELNNMPVTEDIPLLYAVKKYGESLGVESRLMTKEEAYDLEWASEYAVYGLYAKDGYLNYYLSHCSGGHVWGVYAPQKHILDFGSGGIRPVIEVSKYDVDLIKEFVPKSTILKTILILAIQVAVIVFLVKLLMKKKQPTASA